MIYDQLTQPTPQFTVHDDGTETVSYRPPTSLQLQAARAIKDLHTQLQQLSVAHNQLQHFYQQLSNEHETTKQQLSTLQNANTTPATANHDNSPAIEPVSP